MFMRIALCQINPVVGDLEANSIEILHYAERAAKEGADLAVFPELVLIGYPPLDLLQRKNFIEDAELACSRLVHDLPRGLTVAFGSVRRETSKWDPDLRNSVVIATRDKIRAYVDKRLLPNFDVFDEPRYFQ